MPGVRINLAVYGASFVSHYYRSSDNSLALAKIYMSQGLKGLCKAIGVLLARLPPYSYDYNPIETYFALLKR